MKNWQDLIIVTVSMICLLALVLTVCLAILSVAGVIG